MIDIYEDIMGHPMGNITYFNTVTSPADNTASSSSPRTLTPPASMTTGDLVYVHSMVSSTTRVHSIANTGGQTWNDLSGLDAVFNIWWCRFNGTWSANPQFAIDGAATAKSFVMHVFRPTNTSKLWAVDVGPNYNLTSLGTDHLIAGVNTTRPSTVTIANWTYGANSTYSGFTGASGWTQLAPGAIYRNTATSPNLTAYAYKIMTYWGATGDIQRTIGLTTTNRTGIVTFYEY